MISILYNNNSNPKWNFKNFWSNLKIIWKSWHFARMEFFLHHSRLCLFFFFFLWALHFLLFKENMKGIFLTIQMKLLTFMFLIKLGQSFVRAYQTLKLNHLTPDMAAEVEKGNYFTAVYLTVGHFLLLYCVREYVEIFRKSSFRKYILLWSERRFETSWDKLYIIMQ